MRWCLGDTRVSEKLLKKRGSVSAWVNVSQPGCVRACVIKEVGGTKFPRLSVCVCVGMFVCVGVSSLIVCCSKQSELGRADTIPPALPDYPCVFCVVFLPWRLDYFTLYLFEGQRNKTCLVWKYTLTTCPQSDLTVAKLRTSAEFFRGE